MSFRVLIVEDEKELWAKPMEQALAVEAKKHGLNINIDVCFDTHTAKGQLTKESYHFLSLDQHLPEVDGEELSTNQGLELSKVAVKTSPLAYCIAFTARKELKEILEMARIIGADKDNIWQKAVDFRAEQWAEKAVRFLAEDYFSWYYEKAITRLPIPLAIASAKISESGFFIGENRDDLALLTVRVICDFWEHTLHLAWLIGLAHNQPIPAFNKATPNEKEQQLARMLPSFATLYPAAEVWRNQEDFLEASKQLGALRNDFVKAIGRSEGWASRLRDCKPALQIFNDAAACWASAPFIQGLALDSARTSGITTLSTHLLQGNAWPWPRQTLPIKPGKSVIHPDNGVYACVNGNFQTGFELLPMKGYLWLDYDAQAGRNRCYAYSHGGADGAPAFQLDLESGQTRRSR